MRYAPEDEEEPPVLRRLRLMVMALIVVLMLGILAIAATIVIRLGFGVGDGAAPVAADRFVLPEGEVTGMGQGEGTVLFLVRGADGVERLVVFDAETGGAPVSTTPVERE